MIVREIIPINTKKSRIIFDDNESFALYKGEMRRLDIEVGREIDEEEYYVTIYPTLKKRAFARLLHILERSFKSEKYKLMEKGINKEIIDNALEEADIDESPMIIKLLEKKHYFEMDESEKKQKIIASIMRKGYKYTKIKDVIKDIAADE